MSTLVHVFAVLTDDDTRTPVVVLRAVEGEETLPIQIGIPEATSILLAMRGQPMPRPMTHDLLANVIRELGARLTRVEVVDLREGTFYGLLYLEREGERIEVDCRPSDAIALALRMGAPIYVADEVFKKAGPSDIQEESRQKWLSFLHSLENVQGADKDELD